MTIDEEPLAHSVLDVTLDGRHMEGISVPEPLEHSVLGGGGGGLYSGLMEGMSHLEPLEHSVLNVARGNCSRKEASVCESLEHSVRMMTLDDSPLEKMLEYEPLEHAVLDAAVTCRHVAGAPVLPPLQCSAMTMGLARGLRTEVGGPPFGPDPDLTLTDGPHVTGIVDWISDGPVPLPAGDVGRVAWPSADGRLLPGDGSSDGGITAGFQRWNTDGDVEDQYETFDVMPVYNGGDLYDSEDSDGDDPYALASAAYVEDYNFDVPEGMDLMVHRHRRIPDSLDVRQDCQMDVAPVCQTVSNATKDQWDTSDDDSLTATTDENDPYMNDFYQQLVSSEDENYFDSDNGSVTDIDGSMSEGEYCVVSDDGSMADLDVDRFDNVDYDDSDVWSIMDFSNCSSDVDMEDDCVLNMISVVDRELNVYDRCLCLLWPVGIADLRIL